MASATLPEGYSSAKRLHESPSSEVYSALRRQDGSTVVLKRYLGGPAARGVEAARRELDALQAVAGKGVPGVIELILDHPVPVLVMQHMPGVSLGSWAAAGPCDLSAFLDVSLQLATILAHVHASRFIHCDVNPSNVLVDPATLETHLIDFALARRLGTADRTDQMPSGGVEGTLMYIAPEQTGRMNRGCDSRSDLYSLGATLYHALTGRTPFESNDALELIHAHIARLPPAPKELRSDLPEVVSRLVLKLLRKAPEERYQSADALQADIRMCREQLARSGTIAVDFELGAAGTPDRLHFPSRLYGREREISLLRELYTSASAGKPRALWLDGEPGSGKSALVDTLRPVLAETSGHLASGKFDLYRERAYAGWGIALGALMQQLLIESDARLRRWQLEVREGLGSIARALLELVPDLQFILGEMPPVPTVGPQETQARLSLALRRLLAVCSRREHPLVVFLDDVQWSDAGSRFLLEDLLANGLPEGMLLICAYRKAEVDDSHPLAVLLQRLAGRRIAVESLSLPALDAEAAVAMLAEALQRTPHETRGLAELVERKTANNPMLVRQFVDHIHARGLLHYEHGSGWHWDSSEIAAADIPDGAVALMTARIGRLEAEPRGLLEFASCVGDEFDAELLADLSGRDRSSLEPALYALTDAGLIAPCPNGLRFAHGRIRESVRSLLSESARTKLHYDIARILLSRIPEAEHGERAATIVEHLNRGIAHLSEELRPTAIRLNLAAGKRALASGAVASCESFLAVARRLFRPDEWTDAHALGFEIFLRSAESGLLRRDFDGVRKTLEILEPRCTSLLERTQVEVQRIRVLGLTGHPAECIRYTLLVLRKLGLRFPLRPSRLRTRLTLRSVQWRLRARGPRPTFRPAKSIEPRRLAAVLVIGASSGVMSRFDIYLMALVSSWMVKSNLLRGYVARPGYSLSAFATWLQVVLDDSKAAQRVSLLGSELSQKDSDPLDRPRMEMQLHAILDPFRMRRRQALAPLDRVAEGLGELGDLEYAYYARFMKAYFGGTGGESVAETERRMNELADAVRGSGQHYPVAEGCLRIYRLLRQQDLSTAALEAALSESDAFIEANPGSAESYFRTLWVMVLSVFGRHDLAFDQSERLGESLFRLVPYVHAVDHTFYRGLAAAALAGEVGGIRRRRSLRALRAARRKLRRWMRRGPDFQHMEELLAAERSRLSGNFAAARELYEQAAQRARLQDFVHHAALAHERRARMFADLRRETEAAAALTEAVALYARWGAEAKVALLERQRREWAGS